MSYKNMGVTYDRAAGEYGGDIEFILDPISASQPGPAPMTSWRVAKSLETLRDQVNAKWPNRDKSNDGTIGDASHQATNSDHNPNSAGVVTAMDITNDPAHGLVARSLAETLVASRDPRIKYIISNAQIISAKVSPWVWRTYSGSNAHREHVHISVDADPVLYDDARPWSLGVATIDKPPSSGSRRFTNITATVFGGSSDPNNSAYDEHFITDTELGVALPYRFKGVRPKVRVWKDGKSVLCAIVDVGPWNTTDPYWEGSGRPQAETGTDKTGRRTNLAGIDLTPAAARAIGLDGKGIVDWEFVSAAPIPTPVPDPIKPPPDPTLAQLKAAIDAVTNRLDLVEARCKSLEEATMPIDTSTPAPSPAKPKLDPEMIAVIAEAVAAATRSVANKQPIDWRGLFGKVFSSLPATLTHGSILGAGILSLLQSMGMVGANVIGPTAATPTAGGLWSVIFAGIASGVVAMIQQRTTPKS